MAPVRLRRGIKASSAKGYSKPTREQGNGGASAGATGAVAVRNKAFRSQWLCQTHTGAKQLRGDVKQVPVPPVRLRCGIKVSAAKGSAKSTCANTTREQGNGGSGAASASACACAVAE